MKIELTKDEMLALWKRRHFLEPLRADCLISRSDGVDIDAAAGDEMRQWYLKMLSEAPVGLLSVSDVALAVTIRRTAAGTGEISLPDNVVRVVSVRLGGWERAAEIVEAGSGVSRLQGNPFSRGGVVRPVAVVYPGGRLELFSLGSSVSVPVVETLLVVEDPGQERYVMDEALLGLM